MTRRKIVPPLLLLLAALAPGASADADLPPQCRFQVVPCGSEVTAALTAADCRTADGRAVDLYSFGVESGHAVTVTLHAAFTGFLGLVDPDGHMVANSELVPEFESTFIAHVDAEPGVHDLIVSTGRDEIGSRYRLSIGCFAVPPVSSAPCVDTDDALCLGDGRYRVEAWWQTGSGAGRAGAGPPISDNTGWLWFFRESTAEVMVKVLTGCAINGHVWVFVGGLTNAHTALRVTDTSTGRTTWVFNPHETAFQPVQATAAIPCA